MRWRKSSFSGTEVALPAPQMAVRDSKDPDGSTLAVNCSRWKTFLARV